MVRALGLVPFEAQDRAAARDLHGAAAAARRLRALARLTGWTPSRISWTTRCGSGRSRPTRPATPATATSSEVVHDVAAASAHVVAAAAAGRDAVVRYAGCGDFVWVRVEGGARPGRADSAPVGCRAGLQARLEGADMPGGAYSALSGMRTRLEELDRLASDIANVGTAGYKTERAATVAAERPSFRAGARVGGRRRPPAARGSTSAPARSATTGRDLDVAIEGSGFFVVDTPDGERYTRNGSFARRADGVLTTGRRLPLVPAAHDQPPARSGSGTGHDLDQRGRHGDGGRRRRRQAQGRVDSRRRPTSSARRAAVPRQGRRDAGRGRRRASSAARSSSRTCRWSSGWWQLTEVPRSFEALQRGVSMLMNDIDARAIGELGRR